MFPIVRVSKGDSNNPSAPTKAERGKFHSVPPFLAERPEVIGKAPVWARGPVFPIVRLSKGDWLRVSSLGACPLFVGRAFGWVRHSESVPFRNAILKRKATQYQPPKPLGTENAVLLITNNRAFA